MSEQTPIRPGECISFAGRPGVVVKVRSNWWRGRQGAWSVSDPPRVLVDFGAIRRWIDLRQVRRAA